MQTITVKTGLGYIRDAAGNITAKSELPAGEHPLRDGFTYTEVGSQAELDALEVYTPPPTQGQLNEQKIRGKIRRLAVDALKAEGQLPQDYL